METTHTGKLEYQRDEHRVHLIVYHLIWCPKRRKAILVGKLKDRCQQLIEQKCQEKGWKLLTLAIQPDPIHIFIQVWPSESAAEIVKDRKRLLGRIARNRSQTGIIAENEQDNANLWRKIRHRDDDLAHLVSARIVQFARERGASILVFEHLGHLKPEKGRYSRRGNTKRAYWMKGRIFRYSKYKAWQQQIITSRVNPRNTSRECHRCHSLVVRYDAGKPIEGYTPGASLIVCPQCQMRDHADRNASLKIGQRLFERYQEPLKEKPHTAGRRGGRASKETGVARSQDAKRKKGPSLSHARQGDGNAHGTAQEGTLWMDERPSATPHQLRLPWSSLYGTCLRQSLT